VSPKVFSIMVSRLKLVADLGLHGHAMRMQLDRLLPDEFSRFADLHFRRRHSGGALLRSSKSLAMVANIDMLRACSTATNMSAARCCRVWKLPIGTPTGVAECYRPGLHSTMIFSEVACATASAHDARGSGNSIRRNGS